MGLKFLILIFKIFTFNNKLSHSVFIKERYSVDWIIISLTWKNGVLRPLFDILFICCLFFSFLRSYEQMQLPNVMKFRHKIMFKRVERCMEEII